MGQQAIEHSDADSLQRGAGAEEGCGVTLRPMMRGDVSHAREEMATEEQQGKEISAVCAG